MDKKFIKTFKSYREKPTIYGLNVVGFVVTTCVTILSFLTFLTGFSFIKLFVIGLVIGMSYLLCLLLGTNEKISEIMYDEEIPKEFSDDE